MTKRDNRRRKGDSPAKELKKQRIIEDAMQGTKSVKQIAEEYGMGRQAVGAILNGEEVKTLVKLGEARLQMLVTKAIDTLEFTMDEKQEFGMASVASQNARALLKSIGILREKVDLSHTFPRPTVIERLDGSQVILGVETDGEDGTQ